MARTMSLCRDTNCPACGYPQTHADVAVDDGASIEALGCHACGWRVERPATGWTTDAATYVACRWWANGLPIECGERATLVAPMPMGDIPVCELHAGSAESAGFPLADLPKESA